MDSRKPPIYVSVIHPRVWAEIGEKVIRYNTSRWWRLWYEVTGLVFWRPWYWMRGYDNE